MEVIPYELDRKNIIFKKKKKITDLVSYVIRLNQNER